MLVGTLESEEQRGPDFNTTDLSDPLEALIAKSPDLATEADGILKATVRERGICFGENTLPVSIRPHLVPLHHHRSWVAKTEALFAVLEKVARILVRSPELMSQLGLSEEAQALIQIDPGYDRIGVICRPDMMWNGPKVSAYEINADSPAMMTFTDYLQDINLTHFPLNSLLPSFQFVPDHRTESLLHSIQDCYQEWGGPSDCPRIAIVDWDIEKTNREQQCTAAEFSVRGCPSIVCDPRELRLRKGRLYHESEPIDVVYRRILFPDFIRRKAELADLLTAYRDGSVCVVNPLRSYVLGTKRLMVLLNESQIRACLTEEERRTTEELIVPTFFCGEVDRSDLIGLRSSLVLKGPFGHGGQEVLIGPTCDATRWAQLIDQTVQPNWVAQKYVEPPHMNIPEFHPSGVHFRTCYANWNPFMFGGEFAGGMTRVSSNVIVSITASGALLPSIATCVG